MYKEELETYKMGRMVINETVMEENYSLSILAFVCNKIYRPMYLLLFN